MNNFKTNNYKASERGIDGYAEYDDFVQDYVSNCVPQERLTIQSPIGDGAYITIDPQFGNGNDWGNICFNYHGTVTGSDGESVEVTQNVARIRADHLTTDSGLTRRYSDAPKINTLKPSKKHTHVYLTGAFHLWYFHRDFLTTDHEDHEYYDYDGDGFATGGFLHGADQYRITHRNAWYSKSFHSSHFDSCRWEEGSIHPVLHVHGGDTEKYVSDHSAALHELVSWCDGDGFDSSRSVVRSLWEETNLETLFNRFHDFFSTDQTFWVGTNHGLRQNRNVKIKINKEKEELVASRTETADSFIKAINGHDHGGVEWDLQPKVSEHTYGDTEVIATHRYLDLEVRFDIDEWSDERLEVTTRVEGSRTSLRPHFCSRDPEAIENDLKTIAWILSVLPSEPSVQKRTAEEELHQV